ncbi:MAG: SpaA isopeptide-forming pilin-related protein [Bacteroidota bacterium]
MKTPVFLSLFFLLLLSSNSSLVQAQTLEGWVRTDYGRPMPGVKMKLYESFGGANGPILDSMLTDANGFYRFNNLPPGHYQIIPEKYTDPLNGVSLQDVIKISREIILAIEVFRPEVRIYAADIAQNGVISTFDLVNIQKHLLGVELVIAPGWKFLDHRVATLGFPLPPLNFAPTVFSLYNGPVTDANFLVYKLGDVTGNAAINRFTDSEDRSGLPPHQFQLPNLALQAGQSYHLQLRTTAPLDLMGYQLALRYPTEVLEVLHSQASTDGLSQTQSHINPAEGWIRALGYQENAEPLAAGQSLLELHIKAHRSGQLSDFLTVDEQALSAQTYDAALDAHPLHIQFSASAPTARSAFQVAPNPFSGSTRFEFYLDAPTPVRLSIFDARGRQLQVLQAHYDAGQHQLPLSGDHLPKNQLLYFQFEAAGQLEVGKILQQD